MIIVAGADDEEARHAANWTRERASVNLAALHPPTVDSNMRYQPDYAALLVQEAKKVLDLNEAPDIVYRKLWLRMLFLRGMDVARDLRSLTSDSVYSGPFKGMKLTPAVLTGCFAPTLLGCYEHELHPAVERIVARGYKKILNIGCAYGYYAVGLALRMPQVTVDAFDINPETQQKCRDMATLNGVGDRLNVSGEFRGEDFARHAGPDTLAIVDIEAAEKTLLDPALYPALQKIDLLVEMHDLMDASISKTMQERFAPTHDIEIIRNRETQFPLEQIIGNDQYADPFDCLIAAWEVRDGPTPWGMMRVKGTGQ